MGVLVNRWSRLLIVVIGVICLLQTSQASILPKSGELSYCKCICFSNFTIVPLYNPTNSRQPCLSCTKQFCIDQKLPICRGAELPDLDTDTATGKEGDVEARCFVRDSPRDQYIVTLFLLVVFGLLLTAGIRKRLEKAIEDRGRPTDLRGWGEALIPGRSRNFGFGWLQDRLRGFGMFSGGSSWREGRSGSATGGRGSVSTRDEDEIGDAAGGAEGRYVRL